MEARKLKYVIVQKHEIDDDECLTSLTTKK